MPPQPSRVGLVAIPFIQCQLVPEVRIDELKVDDSEEELGDVDPDDAILSLVPHAAAPIVPVIEYDSRHVPIESD